MTSEATKSIDAVLSEHSAAIEQQANTHAMSLHEAGAAEVRGIAQAFFASFRDSITPVHVGEERKAFVRELILRATEAGLFQPEAK